MKAARFHGRSDVRVDEIEPTPVGPSDVRIDIAACGICGSDLHEYTTGPTFTPETAHPKTGASIPVPLGHEFSGMVTEVGTDVDRTAVGDRIAVNPNLPCGRCRYCQDGVSHVCPETVAVGFQTGEGGFAESAVVSDRQVHSLPDDVSLEAGALVEPLAVGHHAVRRSGFQAGDTVAVFGCGPIGLTVVQAAANAGAKRIFASEPNDARRSVAQDLGADVVIDPLNTDVVEKIQSKTNGGVDIAFEFAGNDAAFDAAVRSTVRTGTITVGSLSEDQVSIDMNKIVGRGESPDVA